MTEKTTLTFVHRSLSLFVSYVLSYLKKISKYEKIEV
jgi:hypothetical protein